MMIKIIFNSWPVIVLAIIALYSSYLSHKYATKLQKIHEKLMDTIKSIHQDAKRIKDCGDKPEFKIVFDILKKQSEAIIEATNIILD